MAKKKNDQGAAAALYAIEARSMLVRGEYEAAASTALVSIAVSLLAIVENTKTS